MIRVELLGGLITLCLFVYCLIDVIQTPDDAVRNLPKMTWVLLVFFLPLVGSVAWLAAGRPEKRPRPAPGATSRFPEYDRPGRAVASNPDDDEEFLRRVRERAEEQRRRAEEQRKLDEGGGETPGS